MGNIIAFNPCSFCEKKDMCSMCELQMYREKVIENTEWISVDERLPEESGYFLVYISRESEGFRVNAYYYCEDEMWENGDTMASSEYFGITHWMPLPEPPKMKGGAG